jgi:creatinine amidohydrolase
LTIRTRNLSDLIWHEVHDWLRDGGKRVIIPAGAQEAHGAIGLGTDTIIPAYLAERIAPELDALIAPPLPYGVLRSLSRYTGSISLSRNTYRLIVTEILEGLYQDGFREFILLNGHAGNHGILKDVAWDMHVRSEANVLVYDWYFERDDLTERYYDGPGGHSGSGETAMVLAARPEAAPPEALDRALEDAGTLNPAVQAYPGPYPVILMEEGKGLPEYDPQKAQEFSEAVTSKAIESISRVLERWKRIKNS